MKEADISLCCAVLQDKWIEVKNDFIQQRPGRYLVLTETHRPPERQFQLYTQGRKQIDTGEWAISDKSKIVTNVDGYKVKGPHNYSPAHAIDVAIVDNQNGKVLWDIGSYSCLLDIAKRLNLTSGGSWTRLTDYPHLECKEEWI